MKEARRKAVWREGRLVLDTSACNTHEFTGLTGSQGKPWGKEMSVLVAGSSLMCTKVGRTRGIRAVDWQTSGRTSAFWDLIWWSFPFIYYTKMKYRMEMRIYNQYQGSKYMELTKAYTFFNISFKCGKTFMYSWTPLCDFLGPFSYSFSVFESPSWIWWTHFTFEFL